MKVWVQILISTAVLVAVLGFGDVQGGTDEWKKWHGHQELFKCSGTELKLEPSFHTHMGTCWNQTMQTWVASGKKHMSKHDKPCHAICLGKELGLIDASGKFLKDNLLKFVEEVFPVSKMEELKEELGSCVDEYASGIISNEAGNCSSVINFLRCGSAKVFKICDYSLHNSFIMQHPDSDDE